MGHARFFRIAVMGLLALVSVQSSAAAADWQVSTDSPYPKVGFAEGMNFYSLYVFCDGPTGFTLMLDDGEGSHQPGSRVTVAIVAAGRRHSFRGVVEMSELDGTSLIAVEIVEDAVNDLFDDLSSARTARVIWPNTSFDVPLGGSSQALEQFLGIC